MEIIIEMDEEVIKEFEENREEKQNVEKLARQFKTYGEMIAKKALIKCLETLDEAMLHEKKRKQKYNIERRKEAKSIVTCLGEITYQRTYYEEKKTGRHTHLLDEVVGVKAHERVCHDVREAAVRCAGDVSFEKSAKAVSGGFISRQSVRNYVHQANVLPVAKVEKRQVDVLYIEADEDHVALQKGGCAQPRLVCIHEGIKKVSKGRNELIHPYYIHFAQGDADALWEEVAMVIEERYSPSPRSKIFLAGDGASWIRTGLEWIVGARFVLDKYHRNKYIMRICANAPEQKEILIKAIREGNRGDANEALCKIAENISDGKAQKQLAKDAQYLFNNWDGIEVYAKEALAIGCSAEGHVSHIYSARLSSRPMGWSQFGLNKMARLRVAAANGEQITTRPATAGIDAGAVSYRPNKASIHKAKKASLENFGNLPVLAIGKTSQLFSTLKGISRAS